MKKYSIQLLSGVFLLMLCISVFNWLINPFDIFSSPEIEGVNGYKVEVERHTRISKAYQLERIEAEVILLASSRGIVFAEEYFTNSDDKWFNLSLPSASIYELFRFFQHAQAIHPLKRVVLGLDEDFTELVQPNFSEGRLLVTSDGNVNNKRLIQRWQDAFLGLFSIDALRSSLRTVRKQKKRPGVIDVHQYETERISKAGGHRQMFRTMEGSVFSQYGDSQSNCHAEIDKGIDGIDGSARYFKKIVEFSYKNNIELYIYFSPVHARLYEVMHISGKWCLLEKTKREVVYIVESLAKHYGLAPYPVWDFTGYNGVTTESVPDLGDKNSVMKWYWEGSHFTEGTAKKIFSKIFKDEAQPLDFGVMLTSDNIDTHLYNILQDHNTYLKNHDDDVQELHSIYDDIKH